MNGEHHRKSLFWPVLLVGLGVFLLLVNLGTIPGTSRQYLVTYWPVILILWGLDGLWKRDGVVWSLTILGLGVLFLFGNLGYLSIRALPMLGKIWPILLVAIGLDIAFGHNKRGWNGVLLAGLGIVLVAALFWLAIAFPTGINTRQVEINQPLNGVTSSQVEIKVNSGKLSLKGEAREGFLLEGTARLPETTTLEPVFTQTQAGKGNLLLEKVADQRIDSTLSSEFIYDFALTPVIPLNVLTDVIVGELTADFRETQLASLETNMAVGRQVLYLPCQPNLFADVNQAVGQVVLSLPEGCAVQINMQKALVSVSYPKDYLREGDVVINRANQGKESGIKITINQAVGSLIIQEH